MKQPLEVAIEAARRAGKLLLASYGKLKKSQISAKSKNDFVTDIDRRSENVIISTIRKFFPHDAIQAEESGVRAGWGRLWVIDPLDGTSNYIHQFPMFSISIGIVEDNRLRAGVIFDPVHEELFTAEKGKGAHLNGRGRLRTSKVPRLANALIATGIPSRARDRFDQYLESFRRISMRCVGLRRGGSAALDLAYVACGRFDGFWEIDLSPWDIAAGAIIIQEAGGRVTDLWGRDRDYPKSGDILASNGRIHGEACSLTSKIFTPLGKESKLSLRR